MGERAGLSSVSLSVGGGCSFTLSLSSMYAVTSVCNEHNDISKRDYKSSLE